MKQAILQELKHLLHESSRSGAEADAADALERDDSTAALRRTNGALARLRARVARRPGRWRKRMSGRGRGVIDSSTRQGREAPGSSAAYAQDESEAA